MKQKTSILIGEERPFLIDVIKESFGKDFDCICVRSEQEVYGLLDQVDAVVVGMDVCPLDHDVRLAFVKKIRSLCSKPLIALTSVQYSSVRIELLKAGADDVMTKPFNPDELVVRMKRLLGVL